jgi:predicted nucleotidyltransferase
VNAEPPEARERRGATPFDDLNELLVELVVGVKEVLGDNFCGAYLQGSFAVGDADARSDVDFVVVTEDEVTPEQQDDFGSSPGSGDAVEKAARRSHRLHASGGSRGLAPTGQTPG